jgi:uncharacterized lipoprotein YbaY
MHFIEGDLILPGELPADSARAHVSLIDATYADAASAVLAEADIALDSHVQGPVHFRLALPQEMPANRRWLFDATVTADPSGSLAAGDYVLDHAVEYAEGRDSRHVRLYLVRVT